MKAPRRSHAAFHPAERKGYSGVAIYAKRAPRIVEGFVQKHGVRLALNDGAAGMLIVSEKALKTLPVRPFARIVSTGIAGVDPRTMGMGPVPASAMALKKAGLSIGRIDLIELNEAFASQLLYCMRQLGISDEQINPNGGSIAIGHPYGMTGSRMTGQLLYELRRQVQRERLADLALAEPKAFDELVQRHQGPLFGYLLRMTGIREEAEDVAQDAFIRLGRSGRRRQSCGSRSR